MTQYSEEEKNWTNSAYRWMTTDRSNAGSKVYKKVQFEKTKAKINSTDSKNDLFYERIKYPKRISPQHRVKKNYQKRRFL